MKSQNKSRPTFIFNYNRFLYRLQKHEQPSDIKEHLKDISETIHCDLDSVWGNGCPYVSRVSDKEIAKMYHHCKQHPEIRFLVFDYRERFACTVSEFQLREQLFNKLDVKIFYLNQWIPDFQRTYNDLMNVLEQEDLMKQCLVETVKGVENHE